MSPTVEKLLARFGLKDDRTLRFIAVGYVLSLTLAACVGLALVSSASVISLGISIASLLAVVSQVLFAAHHLKTQRENHRLTTVGEHLDQKVHSDPLTGLMNRIAFNKVLTERSQAHAQGELAVLFFDLNNFKGINDSLGHKTGDMLLCRVAELLTENLPGAVAVARMGGDEFAAILPVTRTVTPEACANAVCEQLAQPMAIEGQVLQSGMSVGIAYGNLAYDEGHQLMKHADMAMYEAKAAGVNGYRVFDDVMEERMSSRVNIRAELSAAIAAGELSLHYQPLVSARTGELISLEALLRWNSPRLGNVSPAVLIPVAEESGQIIELSNWVLDTALAAIKALGDVPIGVNISPRHFRHNQFATMLADKLLAANVRPELLHVEITEGVLISHIEQAKKTIAQVRKLGCKVYLDDFGTGYSSLSYLQNFEIDGMKIDKSFLRDLGERSQTTQIMRSVIDLGHSLNLTVVAEGIECDWQARLLQLLNCDVLQGYHFATPMPFDKIAEFRERQPIQPSGEANEAAVALADAAMRKVARRAGAGASSAA